MTSRRSFLLGIGAALAAPAVVRAEALMKIAVLRESSPTITRLDVASLDGEFIAMQEVTMKAGRLYIVGGKIIRNVSHQSRPFVEIDPYAR